MIVRTFNANMESLANELLLDVFGYFSSIDLLRAFNNLNSRFNQLLRIHFQSFLLDFRSVSLTDFNWICREYLPHRTQHVKSLILSNDDDTPQAIDLFFQHIPTLHSFQSLQSLKIIDLCSNELLIKMMNECQYLPNLTHLTLAGCYIEFEQIQIQQFIDHIWSLSNLIYCYLNVNFGEWNMFMPTVLSRSLKYLFIWGVEHNQQEIDAIFRCTPALEQFSILFNNDENSNDVQPPISMMKKLILDLSIIDENILIRFLRRTPNLSQLLLDISSSTIDERIDGIFNGYQWETIIRNSLPHLRIFRFRMEFQLLRVNDVNQQIDDLFKSFQTSYWLEEHQWFVGCHWNSRRFFFYTLPYAFRDCHFDYPMEFRSTCSDDCLNRAFHHVKQLQYANSSTMNASVSCPLRFPKINDLSLDLPIDDSLRSIVPNFNQITSLHVTTHKHPIASSVQCLIKEIPHFHFLKLVSQELCISMEDLRNISVRRLVLYHHYFTQEEICTLVGIQCEFLDIRIQTRKSIFDLIKNLINLRTLTVICKDDRFFKLIENDFLLSSFQTTDDEFLIWLKTHLPSTYLISRDSSSRSYVHIWIR